MDTIEAAIAAADEMLFVAFCEWMGRQEVQDGWLKWDLHRRLNNETGMLTYSVSRNHRRSGVWGMLEWIRDHAPGSYGLFYCHDDEDSMRGGPGHSRYPSADFDNVFRVHRLKNGQLEELADPFFGQINGDLNPVHPFDTAPEEDPDAEP